MKRFQVSSYPRQESQPAQEEKDEGMTIFGIPIPKIPFSLSFGLAPTISQVTVTDLI